MNHDTAFKNPFRPGAGHMPPYLAGRNAEIQEFKRLLSQDIILENMLITGLRGVGKTVLLETLKPIAIDAGWIWAGTDVSESVCISEENLAIRLLTDLAIPLSGYALQGEASLPPGFESKPQITSKPISYELLQGIYSSTPGLVADKLKAVLNYIWRALEKTNRKGVIFAYDEAQNLSDQRNQAQYPLSLLLDVFQSIQRSNIPLMLVLTGLPTLFPKLVEARTFSERMFRVVFLDRLTDNDSRDAILKPIRKEGCPLILNDESVQRIVDISRGYPYFIQFICREVYDSFIQRVGDGEQPSVPVEDIIRKLDTDFFAGRWGRATDRQRELLTIIANLENSDTDFSVQEIVELSKIIGEKPFSSSHVHQMLSTLSNSGLVYKDRYGKYAFAVPLLRDFILRQPSY